MPRSPFAGLGKADDVAGLDEARQLEGARQIQPFPINPGDRLIRGSMLCLGVGMEGTKPYRNY
jgi:hypothetical protein